MSARTTAPSWVEDVVLAVGEAELRKVLLHALERGELAGDVAIAVRKAIAPRGLKKAAA